MLSMTPSPPGKNDGAKRGLPPAAWIAVLVALVAVSLLLFLD